MRNCQRFLYFYSYHCKIYCLHTHQQTYTMLRQRLLLLIIFLGFTRLSFAQTDQKANPQTSATLAMEVPIQALTSGPNYHWFGYYDKLQTDPSGRYVLGMEVTFEGRSPKPDDVLKIGMIDTQDNNRWTVLGESHAWGWQQGCMLQFIPGSDQEVIWNDKEGEQFVSHILNIKTQEKRTLPFAIYTLSPDGKTALSVDFERINDLRPGYGYAGIADPNKEKIAPANAGIYRCDLATGKKELIISLADIMKVKLPDTKEASFQDYQTNKHWFNHLLFNPDGSRFIFLHRWKTPSNSSVGGFGTLMYTAGADGSDLRLVDNSGYTSHFIWSDPEHICAWTKPRGMEHAFYLFEDKENTQPKAVGKGIMTENGHNTYVPNTNNEWILNDTYPGKDRKQTLYLYHVPTRQKVVLGRLHSPESYKGEWRCDLHPRSTPDGKHVIIDSTHEGNGRQIYWADISEIVNKKMSKRE